MAVYTPAKFEEISRSLETPGLSKGAYRALSRALFPSAAKRKLDAQGRVMIPPELRQHAGITDSAVVVGVNTNAEIWSPERWKAQQEKADQAWQIIDTIELTKDKPE